MYTVSIPPLPPNLFVSPWFHLEGGHPQNRVFRVASSACPAYVLVILDDTGKWFLRFGKWGSAARSKLVGELYSLEALQSALDAACNYLMAKYPTLVEASALAGAESLPVEASALAGVEPAPVEASALADVQPAPVESSAVVEQPKELWIGSDRWEGPLDIETEAIAQLEKLEPAWETGLIEVSFGGDKEGLFSRSEWDGVVHWKLHFVRFDGLIPEDRTIRHYMPVAIAAIHAVVALGRAKAIQAVSPVEASALAVAEPAPVEASALAVAEPAPVEASALAGAEPAPVEASALAGANPAPVEAFALAGVQPVPAVLIRSARFVGFPDGSTKRLLPASNALAVARAWRVTGNLPAGLAACALRLRCRKYPRALPLESRTARYPPNPSLKTGGLAGFSTVRPAPAGASAPPRLWPCGPGPPWLLRRAEGPAHRRAGRKAPHLLRFHCRVSQIQT